MLLEISIGGACIYSYVFVTLFLRLVLASETLKLLSDGPSHFQHYKVLHVWTALLIPCINFFFFSLSVKNAISSKSVK